MYIHYNIYITIYIIVWNKSHSKNQILSSPILCPKENYRFSRILANGSNGSEPKCPTQSISKTTYEHLQLIFLISRARISIQSAYFFG